MKLEFAEQIFEKYSNIKFSENPSSGSLVVPNGQTYVDQAKVTFRKIADSFLNTHYF